MTETLYQLARHFKETDDPETLSLLQKKLRLSDYIITNVTKETANEVLELPEEMLPFYIQSPECVSLIVYHPNYLNIIEEHLSLSVESQIDHYLPKIYLIHQTNSVTIQNPWAQVRQI